MTVAPAPTQKEHEGRSDGATAEGPDQRAEVDLAAFARALLAAALDVHGTPGRPSSTSHRATARGAAPRPARR